MLRTAFALMLLITLSSLSCYAPPSDKLSSRLLDRLPERTVAPHPSIIKGRVLKFGGGGTVEMMYPGGLLLTNYDWITDPPFSEDHIYLIGLVDTDLSGKHVRVVGTAERIVDPGDGMAHYGISYIYFRVDTLQILKR